jgi:hypothetical protein
MADCKAVGKGSQFSMDDDGVLSPVTDPLLFVSWSSTLSPHRMVLGSNKSLALRFYQNVSTGTLEVHGGCTVRVFRRKFALEDAIGSHA